MHDGNALGTHRFDGVLRKEQTLSVITAASPEEIVRLLVHGQPQGGATVAYINHLILLVNILGRLRDR